jgi:hypothetical protein
MDSQDKYDQAVENAKGGAVYITEVLEGDIDLGNKPITELHFSGGDITGIYRVPKTLRKLVINSNKLNSLPSLELQNLVHLEAANNALTTINLQPLLNLAYCNVNNNQCTKIENIPANLKYLYADNNNITSLNLNGRELTHVSCRGNPKCKRISGGHRAGSIHKDDAAHISLDEKSNDKYEDVRGAVGEYYRLKQVYEINIRMDKKLAYNKYKNNKTKLQMEYSKIAAKTKCVNCFKPGGTKFWKDNNGHLRAICGNTSEPCKLDIDILASLNEVQRNIDDSKDNIERAKQEIIQLKMETIFGYTTEEKSAKEYERLKQILNNETDAVTLNDDKYSYYELANDAERNKVVLEKTHMMHDELREIRHLMDNYSKTGQERYLKDAVAKNIEVCNQAKILTSLKYPVSEINVNFNNRMITLNQYPVSIDELHNKHLDLLKVEKFHI